MAKQKTPKAPGDRLGVWKPFFTLIRSVKMPWLWMLLALLVNLFGAQLSLMIPDVASRIMTGEITAATITFMVVTTFLSAILTAVRQTVGRIGENKAEANFRKLMIEKTLNLPVPFYDRNMANLLITRTTTDCSRISEFIAMGIPAFPSSIYSFVGVFVVLFSYHWTLALLSAGMIPIILLVTFVSGRVEFVWNNKLQGKVADLAGYLAEVLANIPLVKVFVKEKTEEAKGEQAIDGIYDARKKYLVFASLLSTLTSAESLIQLVLLVVGGGYLVHHQIISLAKWVAFYGYSNMLVGAFQSILRYYETIKSAQGSARRMAEVIVEQSEDMGGDKAFPEQPQDLAFDHVTFRYSQDTILKGISFTVPAGKTTALVGPSGAGKSTIFGLIERFYDPESGTVTLGGVDAKAYNKLSWRQAIGYVPQSSPMFSGTIRTNMTYGLEREVSEAELIQAAKDANIYEFIQSSEHGFDTDVGERGCKLSGGQRQRVAIARALLKNPKILLMDEATSNLDPEARAEVEKAMERLKVGRTTIIVAHELKFVEHADQIIVLSSGTIDGVGTDESLTQDNKLYRNLKSIQSGVPQLSRA